jgi:hypothetical protein
MSDWPIGLQLLVSVGPFHETCYFVFEVDELSRRSPPVGRSDNLQRTSRGTTMGVSFCAENPL